jgi:uncharacterized protein DUF885
MIRTSLVLVMAAVLASGAHAAGPPDGRGSYADLVALKPPSTLMCGADDIVDAIQMSGLLNCVDFSDAAIARQRQGLDDQDARLADMAVRSWPREQQVDWLLVKSLANERRFYIDVARPWARDPGFYLDPLLEIAFTDVPAKGENLERLRSRLHAIPMVVDTATANLTEGAGEFARLALYNLEHADGVGHYHPRRATPPAGIIGWYDDLLARARKDQPELVPDVVAARAAIVGYRDWLRTNRSKMTGKAGVGQARFDWYVKNVKLMPYDYRLIMDLGRREHDRLYADLVLTRHANRKLPQLALSRSDAEQVAKVADADARARAFLRDQEILTIPDDIGPLGNNTPWIERPAGPNFWEQLQFRDPITDHLHAVIPGHRFDAVIAVRDKRPIRSTYSEGARVEGWGVYLEEPMMVAGVLDGHPRTKEFFYLFGINRAARIPAELKMQTNEWTVDEAVAFMRANCPWLDDAVARVDAEIYLRRMPGYGMGYLIGRMQIEHLLADRSRQLGDRFVLKDFHDDFLARGRLPISLIRWEMTGLDDEVRDMWTTEPIPAE